MRTNPDKAVKEPTKPAPRTLKILISWEKNYGLDVIRKHLDDGLFSRDEIQQKLCYQWLVQRRVRKRNNLIFEVAVGAIALLGLGLSWISSA